MTRVGIIQTHPTQFDGPCFAFLNRRGQIQINAYFTKPSGDYDVEIGRKTGWSDRVVQGYPFDCVDRPGCWSKVKLLTKALRDRHSLYVVSGYMDPWLLLFALVCRLTGRRIGIRLDNVLIYGLPSGLKGLLKQVGLPFVLKCFHYAFATGSLAEDYLKHYRVKADRILRWPYNVDNELFYDIKQRCFKEISDLRSELGIDDDDFVVLGVMKFVTREDPLTLVKGFLQLKERTSRTKLVLVGCGELENELKKLIPQTLQDDVIFVGYQPYERLPFYFGLAHVFVHSAIHECWGCSVNEAMAAGIPVITSHMVGASYDLIVEGQNGFIFESQNEDDLCRCLLKSIDAKDGPSNMGDKSVAIIREGWEYKDIESQLLECCGLS